MQGEEHNEFAGLDSIMRGMGLSRTSIQVDATQSQVKITLAELEKRMCSVELKLDRVLHLLENSTEPNSRHVGDIGESPMKDKRSAENEIEKAVSAKKQKVERDEAVVPDDSDLDSNPKDKSDVKEQPATITVSKKTIVADSSSESDTEDDGIDVDMVDADKSARLRFHKTEEEEKEAADQPRKAQGRPTQSKAPKDSPSSEEYDSDEVPQTMPTPKAKESKTLYVMNLSFDVKESQVRKVFKNAVDVRLSTVAGICKGFGHVEFATAEAAKQAMELNAQNAQKLLGPEVRLELEHSRDNNSSQKGGRRTIFVKGFDTSLGEYRIRSALQKHFGSCGKIKKVSIPVHSTGVVKGVAFMEFADCNSFNAALRKDGSDFGRGFYLNVQVANPRDDSAGGSGGRFGGGGGRRGGRFSGQGGTDGGRGRRSPCKPSVTAMASGKRIIFGDD